MEYVLGADVLAFFERLAERQSSRQRNPKRKRRFLFHRSNSMDDHGVSPEVRQAVFAAQLQLRSTLRDSLRVGVLLGQLLTEAKNQCRHGEFSAWLQDHFEGTPRHARNFMALAREYPDPDDVPALSLREALKLIAGKSERQRKVFGHDRISETTINIVVDALHDIGADLQDRVLGALLAEGLTDTHEATKRAKKARAAVSALRTYLLDQLDAAEQDEHVVDIAAETVGVDFPCTVEELDAAYREKAKQHHPDRGGDSAKFKTLQKAYELLKSLLAAGVESAA